MVGAGVERGGRIYGLGSYGLPGCISEGEARDEALRNIREAIELYLEPVEDDAALAAGSEDAELRL